jgi:hypothetical protein
MTVRSRLTWPFLMDVAKPVARSHGSWPIRRSSWPMARASGVEVVLAPRNWPHELRRTGGWPVLGQLANGRSAA